MPGLVRRFSILLGLLSLGCIHTVVVDVDDREDFSSYQTWDWMPQLHGKVIAPYGSIFAMDARVAGLIETTLREQGLQRSSDHPDFYLTYLLIVTRQTQVVQQAVAPNLLPSMNSDSSWLVEGSVAMIERHDNYRLAIGVSQRLGHMTWRGAVTGRVTADTELPLDDAVQDLFERFPPYDLAPAARQ